MSIEINKPTGNILPTTEAKPSSKAQSVDYAIARHMVGIEKGEDKRIHFTKVVPYSEELHYCIDRKLINVKQKVVPGYEGGPAYIELDVPDAFANGYKRWQQVRKGYCLENGTGFEGYLIASPGGIEEELHAIGASILDDLTRSFRSQYSKKRMLLDALYDQTFNAEAIRYWSETLGAKLGILRAQVLQRPACKEFRKNTDSVAASLPPYVVSMENGLVKQDYSVRQKMGAIKISAGADEAWNVVTQIGKFGMPTTRLILPLVYNL